MLNERIKQQSTDGTRKFLFELADGLLIETVLMPQEYGLSICVTTQVGCNIGCTFCASGIIAKQRDLVAGEIVAQVMHVQRTLDRSVSWDRVSHIVVMGIGEPFDNYDNVIKFLKVVNSDKGLESGLVISLYLQVVWLKRFASSQTKDYKSTLHCHFTRQITIHVLVSCVSTVNIQSKL